MKKLILILILAVGFTVQGQMLGVTSSSSSESIIDADYYVSSSQGDDANDGSTPTLAWKTLSKSKDGMTAGNVIAYKAGDVWDETLTLVSKNGTLGSEITLTSYGTGAKPIFNTVVNHTLTWTNEGSNIWRNTTVTREPTRMKINGNEVLKTKYYANLGTSVPDINTYYKGDIGDGNYLYLYSTDDPNSKTFSFVDENRTLYLALCNYLNISNIEFKGGYYNGVSVAGCTNITFDNVTIGDMSTYGISVYEYSSTNSSNINIINSIVDTKWLLDYSATAIADDSDEFRGIADGISIEGCDGGTINNNYVKNWGHGGIYLLNGNNDGHIKNIKVFKNTVTAPDLPYGGGISTAMNTLDNEVYSNYLIDNAGYSVASGLRNHWHHNIFKDTRKSTIKFHQTGYGISLETAAAAFNPEPNTSCQDNIIENNIFINCESGGVRLGAGYTAEPLKNNTIRNNIAYECGTGDNNISLLIHRYTDMNNGENIFKNNIWYSSVATDVVSYPIDEVDRELITVAEFNAKNGDVLLNNTIESNLSGDPLFISASDYHLQETSPAVNNGNIILATQDYEGTSIPYNGTRNDIGIYESSWTTSPTTPDPTVATPVLSNFNIDNTNLDRVNFDASSDVTGMTTTGFVVSGKTISSVTIDGDGLGGYFTVSAPFTFWDNNTIRLGENDDTSDRQAILHNFTLEYIVNNIPEPTSSIIRYVSLSGNDTNGGTSEIDAWRTIGKAMASATAGTTVWVRAGDYGNENALRPQAGNALNPIKFIGYESTPGDITSMYYTLGDVGVDKSKMPTLDGGNTTDLGYWCYGDGDSFIIFRNLQVTKYARPFYVNTAHHVIFDNCISVDTYSQASDRSSFHFYATKNGGIFDNIYSRVINSVGVNAPNFGIKFDASGCLAKNNKVYCDVTTNAAEALDYYYNIQGSSNIIIGNEARRASLSVPHAGHGISLKYSASTGGGGSTYNLVDNCNLYDINESLQLRNQLSSFNVIKNCYVYGTHTGNDESGGISLRSGAHDNVIENIKVNGVTNGIIIRDVESIESGTGVRDISDNIIRNCIFYNTYYSIIFKNSQDNSIICDVTNNKIQNCTFNNSEYLTKVYVANGSFNFSGNTFENCIYNDIGTIGYQGGTIFWNFDTVKPFGFNNADYFALSSGTWSYGILSWATNSININPNFVNTVDFVPQATLPAPRLFGVEYDYNGEERESTTTIGAQKGTNE